MTDQEINVTIAEACGWTQIHKCRNDAFLSADENGVNLAGIPAGRIARELVPNYCHDLNAMHEAEKLFRNDTEESNYALELLKLVSRWKDAPGFDWGSQCQHDFFYVAHSSARQRAEAFLRTIGKWKET